MTSVTRVNPLQTAIASGSGLEDWPCLFMSRRVTWVSDLGCSLGTQVTRVTRIAQSKSGAQFRWGVDKRSNRSTIHYHMRLYSAACMISIKNRINLIRMQSENGINSISKQPDRLWQIVQIFAVCVNLFNEMLSSQFVRARLMSSVTYNNAC